MKKVIPPFFLALLFFASTVSAQTYAITTVTTTTTGNEPIGIARDKAGNLYLANFSGNTVQEYSKSGVMTTIAGDGTAATTGDGGPAIAAELNAPGAVALDDSGNIYIAENFGNVIRKIDKNGIIHTFAGTGVQGYTGDGAAATAAELNLPLGLVFDRTGNLFIADAENNVIRKVDVNGIITTIAGNGNADYTGDGGQATDAALNYPDVVAVDGYENIYIGDFSNMVIRKVNAGGVITTFAGNGNFGFSGDGGPATDATMKFCDGIFADPFGTVYFSDGNNNRERRVDLKGRISTIAGDGTSGYSGDGGEATDAMLADGDGLVVDDSGYIYIADSDNDAVRKLSPDCRYTLTANQTTPIACNSTSDTITVSGASKYQWSPATGLNTSTGNSVIANPTVTTTYFVTTTDSPSCFSTISLVAAVGTPLAFSLSPLLSPDICPGQGFTITASDTANSVSYTWSPSDGLSATTGFSVVASPTASVTYRVTATGAGGCTSSQAYIVTVNIAPNKPDIHVSVTGDTLFSSATTGNQWYFNDTLIQGAVDTILVITNNQPGTYWVTVNNPANGCSTTSDSLIISGIEQLAGNSNKLSIYPNPTNGLITLTASKTINTISITNLLGQSELKSPLGDLGVKQTLGLSTLPDGIYFITITINNETITRKVIVSK